MKRSIIIALLFTSFAVFAAVPAPVFAQLEDFEPGEIVEPAEKAVSDTVPLAPGKGGKTPTAPAAYTPLAPLPGVTIAAEPGSYFNRIIELAIGLAGILAVLMLVIGGIEYMGSEAFTSKEAGVKKMQGAIWGLLLAIGAWLILNTINPELLRIDFGSIKNVVAPKTTSIKTPSTPSESAGAPSVTTEETAVS